MLIFRPVDRCFCNYSKDSREEIINVYSTCLELLKPIAVIQKYFCDVHSSSQRKNILRKNSI